MFCDSIDGAIALATIKSVVETAYINGANVYWYLRYILENMPFLMKNAGSKLMESMMPWSEDYKNYEEQHKYDHGPPGLSSHEYAERPKTPQRVSSHDSIGQ